MEENIKGSSQGRNTTLPEMRGYLLDIPERSSFEELEKRVETIAHAGFNTIILPFFCDGYSLYPSQILKENKMPLIRPDLKKSKDMLFKVMEFASSKGLVVYAYTDPLLVGDSRTQVFGPVIRRKRKWSVMNRLKKNSPTGDNEFNFFICLNNPEVRLFVADMMIEIAESFPVDAIILDMHKNPHFSPVTENSSCFCDYCRKHVKDELHLDLMTLTLDENDAAFRRWKKWKEEKLFIFISSISGRLREARSAMPFFATVPGYLPSGDLIQTADNSGETDIRPGNWAEEGLVTSLITTYDTMTPVEFYKCFEKEFFNIVDDTLLAPVLTAVSVEQMADFVLHLRKLPSWGYFLSLKTFPGSEEADALSEVPFNTPAIYPFDNVILSIHNLIDDILYSSEHHPALDSFLQDVLLYIKNPEGRSQDKTQDIIEDFRIMELKFQTGDLYAALLPATTLRHLSLIKKLLKISIILAR
jgi:uncharacterized lipoprotein YddW (UPF0748 family)